VRNKLSFKIHSRGARPVLLRLAIAAAILPCSSVSARRCCRSTGSGAGRPTFTPSLAELNEEVIKRATVFVMQTYQNRNQPVISCVGSGTLVSVDGLILTNAHIALPSDTCRSDRLIIALTVRLDQPPIPTYTAEVVDASQGLDLAILRINGYLDGRIVEPGTLQLPFVELGDSQEVQLDDTITVMGYPTSAMTQ